MEKKLQVFISSTYEDLKEERQRCVEAVLNAGHIPAGMELFKAADESQKETIKSWIKESNVLLLILGGRYGSIDPDLAISYTQWEYELAEELKIPIISIVLNDDYITERVKEGHIDGNKLEMQNPKYIEFKTKVKKRMVSHIGSLDGIKGEVLGALSYVQKKNPDLNGWVRADSVKRMNHNFAPVNSTENFDHQKTNSEEYKLSDIHKNSGVEKLNKKTLKIVDSDINQGKTSYKNKANAGIVGFSCTDNNGLFSVGSGACSFDLMWYVVNTNAAHIRAGKNEKIGYVDGYTTWPPIDDINYYNTSSFDRRIEKNESFIMQNNSNKLLAVRLLSAKSKSHGAKKDQVFFEYMCLN